MIHTDEDRRDHDIDVSHLENPNTHYDRDLCEPDPEYVDEDLETVLDLFGSRRRRITIRRLAEVVDEADDHPTIGFEELAREIGAVEDDVDPEIVNWRSLRSVKAGFRNRQLDVLEEHGAIEWDRDEMTITTSETTLAYAALLEEIGQTVASSQIPRRTRW